MYIEYTLLSLCNCYAHVAKYCSKILLWVFSAPVDVNSAQWTCPVTPRCLQVAYDQVYWWRIWYKRQRTDSRVAYLQMQEPSKLTGSVFNFKRGLAVVYSVVGLILADSVLRAKNKKIKQGLGNNWVVVPRARAALTSVPFPVPFLHAFGFKCRLPWDSVWKAQV